MRAALAVIAAAVCALTGPLGSASASDDLAVRASKHPVKETVDRLIAALEAKGIRPAARIDHAAAARANGLELRPTELVLFGNPKVGTPLMQANRQVGIDLPMRVLAWEDDAGKVWLAYTKADALRTRYKLAGVEEPLKAMAGALDAFARAATE